MVIEAGRLLRDPRPIPSPAPKRTPSGDRDGLLRRLALQKVRELREDGMSYRQIGHLFGNSSGQELARLLGRVPAAMGRAERDPSAAAWLHPLDLLDQGVVLFDHSGTLLYANDRAARLFGSAEGAELLQATRGFAELLSALVDLQSLQGRRSVRELSTREAGCGEELYLLRGHVLGSGPICPAGCVMIAFDRLAPAPLSQKRLQGGFGLTPQESRIARLLVEGRSNAQIAARLHISPHTARHHTQRVLRKLGARSRAQAAARLYGGTPPGGEWVPDREAIRPARIRGG